MGLGWVLFIRTYICKYTRTRKCTHTYPRTYTLTYVHLYTCNVIVYVCFILLSVRGVVGTDTGKYRIVAFSVVVAVVTLEL